MRPNVFGNVMAGSANVPLLMRFVGIFAGSSESGQTDIPDNGSYDLRQVQRASKDPVRRDLIALVRNIAKNTLQDGSVP